MAESATTQSMGIVNMATGGFTGAGAIVEVNLGFTPRVVEIFNATDAMQWKKTHNMPANTSIKTVTAGTQTADTTTAITIDTDGFSVSAALAASAKVITWVAYG